MQNYSSKCNIVLPSLLANHWKRCDTNMSRRSSYSRSRVSTDELSQTDDGGIREQRISGSGGSGLKFISSKTILDTADHFWVAEKSPTAQLELKVFETINQLQEFVSQALIKTAFLGNASTEDLGDYENEEDDGSDESRHTFWIDVQCADETVFDQLVKLFGVAPPSLTSELDVMELHLPSHAFVNLAANSPPAAHSDGENVLAHEQQQVPVRVAGFRDFAVTYHTRPFTTMLQVLKQLQHFNRNRQRTSPNGLALSGGWLLSLLIVLTVEQQLPDTSAIFKQIGGLETKALMGGGEDATLDAHMMKATGDLNRMTTDLRNNLLIKDALLRTCLSADARHSFVSEVHDSFEHYRSWRSRIALVLGHLKIARDSLSSTNACFLNGYQLVMQESSYEINKRMQVLLEFMVAFMPAQLLSTFMGMNCTVPFMQANGYTDLTMWACTIGVGVGISICCLIFVRLNKPVDFTRLEETFMVS